MAEDDRMSLYGDEGRQNVEERSGTGFRAGVYGVAFTEDRGQVLLMRGPEGRTWELPGGPVEGGEAAREALARQFSRRVGLAAAAGEPMYFSERFAVADGAESDGPQELRLFFLAHARGTLAPEYAENVDAGGSQQGAAWVPVDELDALEISDDDYDAVQRALQWLELTEGPSPASADEDDGDG